MLDVRGLNKKYKDGFVFLDISFHLNPGDFTVLFGADDAGKTMLLYHILGLQHLKSGEILFDGRSLLRLTEAERRRLRFVPDALCDEPITAKEYFATLATMFEDYDGEDAVDMCEYFGINMDGKLTEMSENENKLVMIIGAMVTAPKLLILDEPMNFLDAESSAKLLSFLKFLSSRGMTILVTCEKADEVKDYCNHYLYLQKGAITHRGLMKDVYGAQKVVSIKGGSASLAKSLLGDAMTRRGEWMIYLYKGEEQSRPLAEIIGMISPQDFCVENISVEEVLNEDYTRWM